MSTQTAPSFRSSLAKWKVAPYLFLAPYLLVTAVFFLYPLINAGDLAFYQTNGITARAFVGLGNFSFVLADADFQLAVWNTTYFALLNAAIMLPLALGLALLLHSSKSRMTGWIRLVLFSPNFVGQIFVGIIFSVMFVPHYGLVNRFLHALMGWCLETRWLQTPGLVIPAITIANLWMYAGFNMIYFFAALQNVEERLVEAGGMDGAGRWSVFWNVTLPAIKPVAVFVYLVNTINCFQLFELPFALLKGNGPANAGLTIVGYLYEAAFKIGDLGLASTVGWVLAFIIFIVSMAQFKVSREFVKQEGV